MPVEHVLVHRARAQHGRHLGGTLLGGGQVHPIRERRILSAAVVFDALERRSYSESVLTTCLTSITAHRVRGAVVAIKLPYPVPAAYTAKQTMGGVGG